MSEALIGAGCFWGVEEYFRKINGINKTLVGYSGGHTENPTYEKVCAGNTEHAEVVKIDFDESIISYQLILEHFWQCHDPTQVDKQGPDVGRQYRSVIFYYNENQKNLATLSKNEKQKFFSKQIATDISEAKKFYLAEEYHQKFIQKRKLT